MLFVGLVFSCKKWEDPKAVDDPRLTTRYCNDPVAVNYNWDFPGKPDNAVCFYPSDLFAGTYVYRDTVYNVAKQLFLSADSLTLNIAKISNTQINVAGLCPSGKLILTAGATFGATVDTTVGDSLTAYPGQIMCRILDTVTGTFTRDRIDSSVVYISLTVRSDTGITTHSGRAIKIN